MRSDKNCPLLQCHCDCKQCFPWDIAKSHCLRHADKCHASCGK